ncbi:HDOD domain-containing protein [Methyloversatilis discipulorum]|uniref:HDOD domain-containing protein n=1 Tax=Methyloversatilis discipulorum TaxID=1119528 RepID=UPI0026ECDEDF|nr:HDOD domain-containing protein [Methyloversatilis discipulorum]
MNPSFSATMPSVATRDFARMLSPADDSVRSFDLLADLARDLRPGVIFPICFDALLCVRQTLRAPEVTTPHLAGAARVDPLLCARLLRRANRGRRAEPVTGVRDALTRLGADRAQRVARAVSCGQIGCARQLSHVDELSRRLWLHTLRTAAGAYVLARRLTSLDPDEAMTAGLLHDIGAFYLLDRLARRPSAAFDALDINALILEWHESVGESLLQSLGVPEVLIDAMRDHEQPRASTGMPRSLSDLVFSASVLAGGATELYDDPVCHVSQRPAPTRERFAGLLPEIEQVFGVLRRGAMQG